MAIQIEAYESASKSGWLPHLAAVRGSVDNPATHGNKYLRLTGYIGGIGEEPTENVGDYIGPDGYVETQEQATDITRYTGDEIVAYLRGVGFTISLPIVSGVDNDSVLVAQDGQWVKANDIRGVLRNTRDNLNDLFNGQPDTLLLPDPGSETVPLIPVYIPPWAQKEGCWGYCKMSSLNGRLFFSGAELPAQLPVAHSGNEGKYLKSEGLEWVAADVPDGDISGYTIEVVDSLPSNPEENTLYLIREP